MTNAFESTKNLWNRCQNILPYEFHKNFVEGVSFCIQERNLRDDLISIGRVDIWEQWKRFARPLIINRADKRYSPENYQQQQEIEQNQRGIGWQTCLNNLLNVNKVPKNAKILVVGGNNGLELKNIRHRSIICVDICEKALDIGRNNQPYHQFQYGRIDHLPFPEDVFDVYISLRTWCVAGVLADEALSEAQRVIKKDGTIIVSLPLSFPNHIPYKNRVLSNAIDNQIKPLAEWIKKLFSSRMNHTICRAEPEDYFIVGRT